MRDRALIAVMTYTFARVGAVLQMRVTDYYVQARRTWVQLHEKGGKVHQVPCHHRLDEYLHEYITKTGIESDRKGATVYRTVLPRGFVRILKPIKKFMNRKVAVARIWAAVQRLSRDSEQPSRRF